MNIKEAFETITNYGGIVCIEDPKGDLMKVSYYELEKWIKFPDNSAAEWFGVNVRTFLDWHEYMQWKADTGRYCTATKLSGNPCNAVVTWCGGEPNGFKKGETDRCHSHVDVSGKWQ